MQFFRTTFKQGENRITILFLLLFTLHFISIHGLSRALILCFEDNGDINIESVAGSFLTIPAEDIVHAETAHNHSKPTFDVERNHHSDIAFSKACSKEQRTTSYDQRQVLKLLGDILNNSIEDLPRSRVFQLASFIPPDIENLLTSNLQTVVLLN